MKHGCMKLEHLNNASLLSILFFNQLALNLINVAMDDGLGSVK
jgi:hypothetical protein